MILCSTVLQPMNLAQFTMRSINHGTEEITRDANEGDGRLGRSITHHCLLFIADTSYSIPCEQDEKVLIFDPT